MDFKLEGSSVVIPMNGHMADQNGKKRRDIDDFSVKLSTIRIWMHEKEIGKLTRILWAGQGNRLCQQASRNARMKRFLAAVPYVMNAIKEVHQAVVDNTLEVLQAKLEPPVPQALVTSKDANGLNIMHKAAGLGHTKILEYLISIWPEGIHEVDMTGKTPLHWAASAKNNVRCYTLLTEAGCDEEAVDYRSKSPSYYRHKPHEIERAFLVYVPDAPRVSPDLPVDWEALNEDIPEARKGDRKGSQTTNASSVRTTEDSIETTSEMDLNDGISANGEDMSKDPEPLPEPVAEPEPEPVTEPEPMPEVEPAASEEPEPESQSQPDQESLQTEDEPSASENGLVDPEDHQMAEEHVATNDDREEPEAVDMDLVQNDDDGNVQLESPADEDANAQPQNSLLARPISNNADSGEVDVCVEHTDQGDGEGPLIGLKNKIKANCQDKTQINELGLIQDQDAIIDPDDTPSDTSLPKATYLNGQEEPDALDRIMSKYDQLLGKPDDQDPKQNAEASSDLETDYEDEDNETNSVSDKKKLYESLNLISESSTDLNIPNDEDNTTNDSYNHFKAQQVMDDLSDKIKQAMLLNTQDPDSVSNDSNAEQKMEQTELQEASGSSADLMDNMNEDTDYLNLKIKDPEITALLSQQSSTDKADQKVLMDQDKESPEDEIENGSNGALDEGNDAEIIDDGNAEDYDYDNIYDDDFKDQDHLEVEGDEEDNEAAAPEDEVQIPTL